MDWDLLQDLRRGGRDGELRCRGAPAGARAIRRSAARSPSWKASSAFPLFARSNEGLSLTAQAAGSRACRRDGGAAALRAGSRCRDGASGARRRQAVDRFDARLALADAAARSFLRAHDHIQLEIITHPFHASVRRREADVRAASGGQRRGEPDRPPRFGRLGTGFYASRDYAARRRLPERRDEWKGHSVIGFCRPVARTSGWRAGATRSHGRARW